jgi:hypothetical protein
VAAVAIAMRKIKNATHKQCFMGPEGGTCGRSLCRFPYMSLNTYDQRSSTCIKVIRLYMYCTMYNAGSTGETISIRVYHNKQKYMCPILIMPRQKRWWLDGYMFGRCIPFGQLLHIFTYAPMHINLYISEYR